MPADPAADTLLEPLAVVDAAGLPTFEIENRTFFEMGLPGRGDAHYDHDAVAQTTAASAERGAWPSCTCCGTPKARSWVA